MMKRDAVNNPFFPKTKLLIAVAVICISGTERSWSEVRSCTLGIDTNCPSGLSE